MAATDAFEAERPRLLALATRVLADHAEAEDVVQQAWLRLQAAGAADARGAPIANLPAWLTTVTTRLCLDRLRARTPVPLEEAGAGVGAAGGASDPAHEAALAESIGIALHLVLDRLSPRERVALVLHDSFGFDFAAIAAVLDTTPVAARKLASRPRQGLPARRGRPVGRLGGGRRLHGGRPGRCIDRLVRLLARDADVAADEAAVSAGTPQRVEGRRKVAEFFTCGAHAALAVFYADRPAAAWYHRGRAMVIFDFTVHRGRVERITFRAAPEALALVRRRDGAGHPSDHADRGGESAGR